MLLGADISVNDCGDSSRVTLSGDGSRLRALLSGLETRSQLASHHSANHRCIGYVQKANGFAEAIDKLRPHVEKAAAFVVGHALVINGGQTVH